MIDFEYYRSLVLAKLDGANVHKGNELLSRARYFLENYQYTKSKMAYLRCQEYMVSIKILTGVPGPDPDGFEELKNNWTRYLAEKEKKKAKGNEKKDKD